VRNNRANLHTSPPKLLEILNQPLVDAEYDGFSFGTTTPGDSSESTERGFVELERTFQAFGLWQNILIDARAVDSVKALNRLLINLDIEAEPLRGNTKAELLEQTGFGMPGESAGQSPHPGGFETMTTCRALEIPGRKRPEFSIRTPGAVLSSHNPLADITIPGYQLQVLAPITKYKLNKKINYLMHQQSHI